MFYVGKSYTATLSGSVIKPISCGQCRKEYFYELARTAQGHASAPYYINQRGAERRAERRAANNLNKRLTTEHEAVACPHCGWVQEEMVSHLRHRRLRWLVVLVWVLAIITLAVMAIIALIVWSSDRSDRIQVLKDLGGYALIVIVAAGAMLSLRWMIALRIDPNRNFPQRSPRLPGTPPALMKQVVDGVEKLAPVDEDMSLLVDGWVEIQLERCDMPPKCCICLEPAQQEYTIPLQSPVMVPMCKPCRGKTMLRWWMWVGLSILIAAGVAALPVFLIGDVKANERWGAFAFLGIMLAIPLIILLPRLKVKIYRSKNVDNSRGVVRIWFANSEYTRLLEEQYRNRYQAGISDPTQIQAARA